MSPKTASSNGSGRRRRRSRRKSTSNAAEAEQSSARYPLVDEPRGLVCGHSPNIRLLVERGLTATEETRGDFPAQSIFLDGVFDGGPFLDNKARQYSLDHHVGCPRPLMLASCEQAVVLLLQGIPLQEGDWQLYVNEPDLDAVLAAWVLLNHQVLLDDYQRLLQRAMPLIRVEGLIDAHGLDMGALSALPQRVYEAQKARLDELRAPAVQLKADGAWESTDPVVYTQQLLESIDAQLLGPLLHRGAQQTAKLEHVDLPKRKRAILCCTTEGIYEVETRLRQRYHDELGMIVLDRGGGRMTLRLVDHFLPHDLSELYPVLNERDPNVDEDADNRWGGSDDIGGSPRTTGTGLTGADVLRAVASMYPG